MAKRKLSRQERIESLILGPAIIVGCAVVWTLAIWFISNLGNGVFPGPDLKWGMTLDEAAMQIVTLLLVTVGTILSLGALFFFTFGVAVTWFGIIGQEPDRIDRTYY